MLWHGYSQGVNTNVLVFVVNNKDEDLQKEKNGKLLCMSKEFQMQETHLL